MAATSIVGTRDSSARYFDEELKRGGGENSGKGEGPRRGNQGLGGGLLGHNGAKKTPNCGQTFSGTSSGKRGSLKGWKK